eukprot:scaffold10331_cov71-Phaeocystis_antarctica.AAC.2
MLERWQQGRNRALKFAQQPDRKEGAVVQHDGQSRTILWRRSACNAKQRAILGQQASIHAGKGSRGSTLPYARSDALVARQYAAVAAGTEGHRVLRYPLLEAGPDEELVPLQQHEPDVSAPRPAAREAWPLAELEVGPMRRQDGRAHDGTHLRIYADPIAMSLRQKELRLSKRSTPHRAPHPARTRVPLEADNHRSTGCRASANDRTTLGTGAVDALGVGDMVPVRRARASAAKHRQV